MKFFYTYVLKCADTNFYIGSTSDLKKRLDEHCRGASSDTSKRLPIELVYYEACRSIDAARERERQLKTGFGRGYLRKRLGFEFTKKR